MNGRQSAYSSAQSIIGVLENHGSDCPKCSRFASPQAGFKSRGYYILGPNPFDAESRARVIICDRCRGFGRILDVKVSLGFISNFSEHEQQIIDHIVRTTDCPF